ncbi:MAG TPA: alpha/beta fold hydrolase [Solirubrobacteraceae bacterium]|jgi:polyhydroxyalkanoate synthase
MAVHLPIAPDEIRARVDRDVRRAVRRGRNGLRYAAGTSRPAVGCTPKDVIWKRDKAELWRYRSDRRAYAPPVVVVHSLVSRSYVLDLHPNNSAVKQLLAQGLDMMLLDWGVADAVEACNGLETYADDYIPRAIEAAREAAGTEDVTVLGYCFGGVLSLLSCARHPEMPVRNLIAMATPVDFDGMQAMTGFVRRGRLGPGEMLDETGNVPPEAVENAFRLLRPTAEASQYATLWQNLWNDEFVDGYQAMAQWTRDHVPFPGVAFGQTAQGLVRENGLLTGTLRLAGEPVDLGRITVPFLNVMAEHDTIVPVAAARPATGLVGSAEADQLCLKAGHVGLVASRTAAKVTLPRIAEWIKQHSDRTEPEPSEE